MKFFSGAESFPELKAERDDGEEDDNTITATISRV